MMLGADRLRIEAEQMPRRSLQERIEETRKIAVFLRENLLAHAAEEERITYPLWARAVGYADVAESMIYDHRIMEDYIKRLEHSAGSVEDLQEILYGLHALLVAHIRKEEALQFPVLDALPLKELERKEVLGY